MVAGDARVGDNQILINLASDGERSMVEVDGALIVPLHEDQRGENSRPWRRDRTRDGLKSHAELPYSSSILKNGNDRTAGPTRPDAGTKSQAQAAPLPRAASASCSVSKTWKTVASLVICSTSRKRWPKPVSLISAPAARAEE